jgi:hypothetical protein
VRLAVLLTSSVAVYVLVAAITGAPVIVALLFWSVVHSVRSLRRSEWAPWIAALEQAEPRVAGRSRTG